MRQLIEQDVPALSAAGKAVLRPAVFLMTDGIPTDPEQWPAEFARLADRQWKYHPHVITYGFSDASKDVLAKVATKAAFAADNTVADRAAITEVITSMLRSLVASAGAQQLLIPDAPEGFTSVPLDFIA